MTPPAHSTLWRPPVQDVLERLHALADDGDEALGQPGCWIASLPIGASQTPSVLTSRLTLPWPSTRLTRSQTYADCLTTSIDAFGQKGSSWWSNRSDT
jgi:hypothetical protein